MHNFGHHNQQQSQDVNMHSRNNREDLVSKQKEMVQRQLHAYKQQ